MTGACASDLEIETADHVAFATGDTCPTNSCGDGNSPVIKGVYFWRLSLQGKANPEGVRILDVSKDGVPLALELVGGDRLRAVGSGFVLEHQHLEDVVIKVSVPVNGVPTPHEIEIVRVAPNNVVDPEEQFWVGPQDGIEAYEFFYTPTESGTREALCSDADGDPNKVRALVFGGDLYNPLTKAIQVGPSTNGWINIACADSATYKMHKIGHTAAAGAKIGIPTTTVPQRRAMLNAWTANVCGDGTSYTDQGVPIRLRESLDLLPVDSQYLDPLDPAETISFEAIWNETGAVCLNAHRLDPWELGLIEIPCRARLPRCTDMLNAWFRHGHVATACPYTDDP